MEFSFYGWIWIVLGAIFGPVQVMAYIASIVKILIDRSRIKKGNTHRRKTRLNGISTGKRPNILIVTDEERALKFLQNGLRRVDRRKSSSKQSNLTPSSIDCVNEQEHKQNGGHAIKVTVEHNIMMQNQNGDPTVKYHNCVHKNDSDKAFSEIPEGINETTAFNGELSYNDDSVSKDNLKIVDVTDSKFVNISDKNAKSSDTSLPQFHQKTLQKQPPPKPKRNKHRLSHTKTQSLNETDNFSSSGENITCVLVTCNSTDNKHNFISPTATSIRRYSYASTHDHNATYESPNRSLSEDNLILPSSGHPDQPDKDSSHLFQETTDQLSGHNNVGFVNSIEEIK